MKGEHSSSICSSHGAVFIRRAGYQMAGKKGKPGRTFYITAAGHRLAAEFIKPAGSTQSDRSPTLIFLHEGLGSIGQWKDFPRLLSSATRLPALVYDRWGHGGSDPLQGRREAGYLHDEALDSLPRILKELGIRKTILVGHSDGGSIALIFAAKHPGNVSGVITEAAHVFVEDVTIRGIQEAVRTYEAKLRDRLSQFHGSNTDLVFRGWTDIWLSPEFRDWNIREYLPKITAPTLAIQGFDDEYGTPVQVETIVKNVTGRAEGKLIFNCGHIPHHQARERVLTEMSHFIASLLRYKYIENRKPVR
jgi:pimeloyl-ACP methyl ester carboxylesterase